ncbi:LmeA family phospholipid-binding protein [Actinomadura sp. 3N407]|uniref:LmeA family phospholipid-binding protein n=1 Tax=Actinomadura sp. 3N407 TaxID=3457423 RepID=UPI003FCE9A1D
MRKVLVVLLILAIVGVVAADRIGVRIAEDRIAQEVSAQSDLTQPPEVTIHGIPFLTQVIGGEYGHIELAIGDWTEQGVTVTDVRVDMRGVSAPLSEVTGGNTANVTARTATVSAVVPYPLIKKHAPKEVKRIAPKGDNLAVDMEGSVLGFRLSGTGVVEVEPTARGIAVSPVSVESNGGPQVPLAAMKRQLTWVVPVPALPLGAKITEIRPTAEGLRVGATAENVKLNDIQQVQK